MATKTPVDKVVVEECNTKMTLKFLSKHVWIVVHDGQEGDGVNLTHFVSEVEDLLCDVFQLVLAKSIVPDHALGQVGVTHLQD